jgi:plastocyanin
MIQRSISERKSSMIRNAVSRAYVVPLSAALCTLALEAAAAAPQSMPSHMHVDHAGHLRAETALEENTIVLKNFHFSPVSLTVPAGTAVTWKNLDGEPHTIVSIEGVFRSDALDQDDVFTYTFNSPGTYKFLCSIHPQMRGTIIVQ